MRGGARKGAGRPGGGGKYGEKTTALRVPLSKVEEVKRLLEQETLLLPLYHARVAAGFPSPSNDDAKELLNLNDLLVKRPAATFFVRVSGDSMIRAGIHHNDILVVDRSLEPLSGKVVVAAVNGELLVKRLHKEGSKLFLLSENSAYPPISIGEGEEIYIWGVVTNVIHPL